MFIYRFTDAQRNQLAVVLSLLLVISLIYSRAGISIAQIGFSALAIFQPNAKSKFKQFLSNKAFLATTTIFFVSLISGLYGTINMYLVERLRMVLPFLMLPFAFAMLPNFSKRQFYLILYTFISVLFISCIQVGIQYGLDFEAININVGRGQPIPTPINHIRFSLLLAFSILVSGYLYSRQFYWKFSWEKYFILGVGIFQFVFIHVLSVRSGLMVLYLSILVWCAFYVIQTKRYWILGGVVALMSI